MNRASLFFRALEIYGVHLHHPGQWRIHEKLRKWSKADAAGCFEVKRKGFRWMLNPADFVESDLFWLGEKDRWDSFHIRRIVQYRMARPGAAALDVGANFGYYSICVFQNCRVFAFEPFPANRDRLLRNLRLNGLKDAVTVLPYGLSDFSRTTHMLARGNNSGSAAIGGGAGVEVSVCTLDEFCCQYDIDAIAFIKIDVEGHEQQVLKGGQHTIRELHPPLMVELDPSQLKRAGSKVEDVIATLNEYGYKLMTARRASLVPLNRVPVESEVINVFCLC